MKSAKKIISALMLGMFVFSAAGCDMIEKTPEGISKQVVAKVNDEKVTKGEIDKLVKQSGVIASIEQQYGTNYTSNEEAMNALNQQKGQLLDSKITEVLFLQKAKELKLMPSDSELNKQVTSQYNSAKKQYKTDTEWKSALKQAGYTEDELKEQMKNGIIEQKVLNYIYKGISISDSAAKSYYEKNQSSYTEKTNTINVSHILLKTEDEAKKVETRIKNGEDFAKIAKEVSTDTGSKDKGGSLGDIQQGDTNYDATFMAAAWKLKAGEVSQPVKTQFGWHVIKCVKKTEYPVKAFDKVKADIKSTLLKQKQQTKLQDTITKWKKAAKITKYEKNL
ncbi:peptidylprolyl isomerase [Clostridium guangxiense]|uniref:peptidylprolyl isomerase n=1 Tax=Clostridium guangxiense TaxID=1662055 RepID=UPI001E4F5631|nr:peptidylprolyl isomerase [Clostridium guangxiense]MCD2347869.1 peptidylprolyl isomerase [Clostridium guangxiense]